MTKLDSRTSWRNSKIHWDGEWFIEQEGKTSCSQGIKSTRDLDVKASWLKLNVFCFPSVLGCTSLPVPALQRSHRVGSETATVDLHLGTIPATAACHIRSWVKPSSLSAVTLTHQRRSGICTRAAFRKASGSSQGRAQTCQVKKGTSPTCKHFLSGREHFLNPGTTTSVACSPANRRQWHSLFTARFQQLLILPVKAESWLWVDSPMWVALEQT